MTMVRSVKKSEMKTKICKGKRGCGKEKPLEDFNKNRNSKDGYDFYCRICCSLATKIYHESNPEKLKKQHKEQMKRYHAQHPERRKSQARVSYERFRDQQPFKYKLKLIIKHNSHSYARHLLSYRTALEPADIPDELVELKLAQILLKRLIKKGA